MFKLAFLNACFIASRWLWLNGVLHSSLRDHMVISFELFTFHMNGFYRGALLFKPTEVLASTV
jgi:hypothetical protein